ncbi:hypothetical protein HanRHA438_Chr07g0297031 [Helianthus annuus]|nr:hypothetical protein HanRHA438_Chr07g0297031 [Helianthus annuus]
MKLQGFEFFPLLLPFYIVIVTHHVLDLSWWGHHIHQNRLILQVRRQMIHFVKVL